MARSLEARIARLEAPHGNVHGLVVRNYRFLKACYEVLSRMDREHRPTDAELWAMAQAEGMAGAYPDYTATLQAVWAEEEP
jgi:hypothetical protein